MEKNSLEKLKNLMLKKYRKEISFRQLQKEFLKNDNERIEYIKTELEKAYNEKNGKSINTLILAIYSVLSPATRITFYDRLHL